MLGPLKPFNTISPTGEEGRAVERALFYPLSGYLAGNERSNGYYVTKLEEEWAHAFRVKHAIACNSCTSGLLAACVVSGVGRGCDVIVPAITMSATAAVPSFLGADIVFGDIDQDYFCLSELPSALHLRAVIVTNLFGHPAHLSEARQYCDERGVDLIEDNAQAIFALENGLYTGTIGHIGCFSLNVHKHIHSGEGGIICTNDDDTAEELRGFINHGENLGLEVGLNLRMPELCAAVASVQLSRASEIVGSRIKQAKKLIEVTTGIPGVEPPHTREGCTHSYYHVAWKVSEPLSNILLYDYGHLFKPYVAPLYRLPAFERYARKCPVAEKLHGEELVIFENCAWDLTDEQIEKIGDLFRDNRRHIPC